MNLLELASSIGVHGFLHCNELEKLVELATGREVLEVGAFRGLSAWGMAISAKRVDSVDTFKANTAGQTQMNGLTTLADYERAVSRFSNVRWFVGTSEQWSARLMGYDFIFIDAMHTYEEVRLDLLRWRAHVNPGGILAMHDYGHHDFPGVKQAADEIFGPAEDANLVCSLRWIQM